MRTASANDLRPGQRRVTRAAVAPEHEPGRSGADALAGDAPRAPVARAAPPAAASAHASPEAAPGTPERARRAGADPTRPRHGRLFNAVGFALVSLAMRAAVRVYFRRVRVRHRAHFPRTGAVLLVANHPAMWTDVLVLDVALGRKLHFLAQSELFRPPLRGLLLEVHGALPVFQQGGPEGRSQNSATFERCRELFAGGRVVALFPEGVSETDRQVLSLKTGAARIALDAAEHGLAPVVLAAGIHYADRTSYGSEVTVSVGEPVALAPFVALRRDDPEAAVHALTGALHDSLRTLILDLPEPALAAAVSGLEPLAGLSRVRGLAELESAQRVAATLRQMHAEEPARFAGIRRHARVYRRAKRALGLSDRALHWSPDTAPWRQRTAMLTLFCALGAVPAALGGALHLVPWATGEWVAHTAGRDPSRFAFGRISSGLVFFPAAYAALFLLATQGLGIAPAAALGLLALGAVLGLFTLQYAARARALAERAWLMLRRWSHPRLVARAQRAQRALLQLLAEAAQPVPGEPGEPAAVAAAAAQEQARVDAVNRGTP